MRRSWSSVGPHSLWLTAGGLSLPASEAPERPLFDGKCTRLRTRSGQFADGGALTTWYTNPFGKFDICVFRYRPEDL